ncbi:hypothetical protein ILYODFUR_009438 [Ilyodon furcidens]|uniref:Ig-like domain-containing protein n=1 Tax=Ilyodon furcidens TaxID=33524 RepID=A0ABV0U3Y8_9TELE
MNLATLTKRFGSRVRPDLDGKMDFQHEALQSCSVVIRKVTEQDEGCYRCLFNTYPSGALIGKTCLTLYELHEPILDVRRSNSPTESVVSCSATGRPAPSVTLTVLDQNISFSQYDSTSVTNSNGTVTITTTALLSAFSSTEVGCSVSVLSAAPRELLVTVPGLTEMSEDVWGVTIAVVLICGSLVASVSIFCCRKMHHNRKLQVVKETEEQTKHAPSVEQFMQEKTTREVKCQLIKRSSSKLSPVTPTTPDVESCSPEGINLHQKLKGRKSS